MLMMGIKRMIQSIRVIVLFTLFIHILKVYLFIFLGDVDDQARTSSDLNSRNSSNIPAPSEFNPAAQAIPEGGWIDNMFGSIGRSNQFDPFQRTRNVPFRIFGRRRSISVMTSIND